VDKVNFWRVGEVKVTHLKGLCVPYFDLFNRRHATQIVGKVIEFLGSVRQSNGELLYWRGGTELENSTLIRSLSHTE